MTDSYKDQEQRFSRSENPRDGNRGNYRGGRAPGNREGGGFRIRLSDNEMRSARALQEAFGLRSTVAVLGFALRTLGQMLEEGKLEVLRSQYKEQSHQKGDRRSKNERWSNNENHGTRPDPFARPTKPSPEILNADDSENNQDQVNPSNEVEQSSAIDESTSEANTSTEMVSQDLEDTSIPKEESKTSSQEA